MLKFFRSPKTSPNPSHATSSPPTASSTSRDPPRNSINNSSTSQPDQPITGLGITNGPTEVVETERIASSRMKEEEERREQQLEVPPSSSQLRQNGSGGRRESTSEQQGVHFVDTVSGIRGQNQHLPTGVQNGRQAGAAGMRKESYSEDTTRSLSPSMLQPGGAGGGNGRAVSPMSFSPSVASSFHNPYGPSVSALTERDPNQIYAPTTWSDMAHQELVSNLSARERTRQEILWEVVASEERYVVEIRSLVEHYSNPLLHPLLSTSPPLSSPPLKSTPFSRQSFSAATASSSDLPIAARFLRSTPSSVSSNSLDHLPEIRLNEQQGTGQNRSGNPTRHSGFASEPHLPSTSNTTSRGMGGKLAAFVSGRSRQSSHQNSAAKSTNVRESVPPAPPLPAVLRIALESTLEMLKGHEELSAKLKEQWTKSFPLVRGLGATWSDQPWFLQTYSSYIVSLEEALSIIDSHLPSSHPTSTSSSSPHHHFGFKSSETKRREQNDARLTKYLQYLEREAGVQGESSLSICLSKPLMRMSKLPLLMQALLFHTDPTTHEWEKTRAMALEVDALVRSIEDEKIEEEQRERTRDVLARIEGINDRGLMIPRSSRILIAEQPAPPPPGTSSSSSALPFRKGSTKRSSRRVSAGSRTTTVLSKSHKKEWLIKFTDVVIRAQKIGETNVPGSFSREKEKQGKQGKTRKSGPLRNTYRFLYVERWESPERAEAAWNEFRERPNPETVDEESDHEETVNYAESRMSFRYDSDEPQPITAPRDFSSPKKKHGTIGTNGRRSVSTPVPDNVDKFANRLRLSEGGDRTGGARSPTPGNRNRFDSPTLSSALKSNPMATSTSQLKAERRTPVAAGNRNTTNQPPPPPPALPPKHPSSSASSVTIQTHSREESTYNLYKMWSSTQE
ncbi:uncharacterized protein JCM6883_002570 [Sporobolomyces salmoneus]|uniref:uncharacterized protein n=1 Tax=Sporobolomyces salmoneus TaxID=183962 RepID=UPI0031720E0F